jgi:hypothetical protein
MPFAWLHAVGPTFGAAPRGTSALADGPLPPPDVAAPGRPQPVLGSTARAGVPFHPGRGRRPGKRSPRAPLWVGAIAAVVRVLALGLMISVASAFPPGGAGRAHSAWAQVSASSPEAAGAQGGNAPTSRSLLLGPRAKLARIITPRDDKLLTGRALRVVVSLRPGTMSFRAWVDRRDVTRRFGRRSARRRSALIPRRLLRRGPNDLVVRTGDRRGRRDFDHVRVIKGRRHSRLLSVRVPGAARRHVLRTSGTLRMRARLRGRVERVAVRLNGRAVPGGLHGGIVRRGRLAADDGLRFGRNLLTITVWHPRGAFDRERRVVFVSRARPLAAAGRHRRVRAGARVRLDARASRPRRRGERLAFAWRVLRGPKGASPRLLRRRSARPAFIPDRPGRYRLRLRVRGRGPGAPTSTDVLDACVQPDYPPLGAALNTHARAGNDPAIQVGDKSYPYPSRTVGLVVLDRCSLTPLKATWFIPGAQGQVAYKTQLDNVVNAAKTQGRSYLVMLTAEPGVEAPMPSPNNTTAGFAALTPVGPTSNPDPTKPDIVNVGGAVARDPNASPDAAGALTGYLQLDNHGLFTLARPFTPEFDSRQVSVNGQPQAQIKVGSRSWTFGLPQEIQAGFMMLALDRSSLRPVQGTPYTTQVNGGPFPDLNTQAIVARQLQSLRNTGALVFVQSIGNPKPTTPAWADIALAIESLGGTAHVFNTLDGSGGYSLVGCGACSWPAAQEASYPLTKPYGARDGRLSGGLGLNDSSQWAPLLSDLGGGFDYGLANIVAQSPSSWPCGLDASNNTIQAPCDKGHQAALSWITDQVLPANDVHYQPDSSWCQQARTFRNAYCSATLPWNTTIVPKLRGAGPDALSCADGTDADGDRFTKQDCQDVQRELLQEVGWRETVTSKFELFERPLDQTQTAAYIDLKDILDWITRRASTTMQGPQGEATPSMSQLMTVGLAVLSLFPGGGDVATVLGALTEMITAASETTTDQNGAPAFEEAAVAAYQLANEMAGRYLQVISQLDRLGDQALSDYAKLKTVAGPPQLRKETVDSLGPKLRTAGAQWIWQRLLPRAYWMFKFRQPKAPRLNDLSCIRSGEVFNPFRPLSDNASWTPILGFDQNMSPQKPVWYAPGKGPLLEDFPNGPLAVRNFEPAPGPIFDNLWKQPPSDSPFDPTKPGLYEPWFHRRAVEAGKTTWLRYLDYSVGRFPGYTPVNRVESRPCWYGDSAYDKRIEP